MKKVGIPEEICYRPKWQIALAMICRARRSGLTGPVIAGTAYGAVIHYCQELDLLGMQMCLGIDSTLQVIDADEDLGEVGLTRRIGRTPV